MVALARIDAAPRTARSDRDGSTIVERGDTLSQIASEAGVSLRALIQAHPQIANPNLIYPGDRIRIPTAVSGGRCIGERYSGCAQEAVRHQVGATDVAWAGWVERHHAPAALFALH